MFEHSAVMLDHWPALASVPAALSAQQQAQRPKQPAVVAVPRMRRGGSSRWSRGRVQRRAGSRRCQPSLTFSGGLQQLEVHVGRCSIRGKGHFRFSQRACVMGGLRVAGCGLLGIPCELRHLHNGRVRMRRACRRRCTRREGCMDMCSYARSHAMLSSGAEIETCILECAHQ